jgi:hypothetical protein
MFQSLPGYRTHLHFTNVASEFVLGRVLVPRFRRVYRYDLKKSHQFETNENSHWKNPDW